MPAILQNANRALLKHRCHTWANCWTIERVDGTVLRFTDHSAPLVIDGATFLAAGGFNASARQAQIGLRTRNMDIVGVISASGIVNEDLRVGLYREARITERVVDWKHPWVSPFIRNRWWVSEITYNEERWEAKVDGVTRWLRHAIGENYTRWCRADLGDDDCTVNLATFTDIGEVTAVASPGTTSARYAFNSDLSEASAYYTYGLITWLTGANADLTSEVHAYANLNGRFRLTLATPFDILVGDTFEVYAGCDKLRETCKTKFNNIINFRGYPDIPGTDSMYQTPRSQT